MTQTAKDQETEILDLSSSQNQPPVVTDVDRDQITWEAWEAAVQADIASHPPSTEKADADRLNEKFNLAFNNVIDKVEATPETKQSLAGLRDQFNQAREAVKDSVGKLKAEAETAVRKFSDAYNSVMAKVDVSPQVRQTLGKIEQDFTNLKKQVQGKITAVVKDPQKAASTIAGMGTKAIGKSLEKTGVRLEQAGTWLSDRPRQIEDYNAAKSAISAAQKGFERIQTDHHRLESGHHISRKTTENGQRYLVGLERSRGVKPEVASLSFNVDNKGKISDVQRHVPSYNSESLRSAAKADIIHAANPRLEAAHKEKSDKAIAVASAALSISESKQITGKTYVFSQSPDGGLKISAKDRRGVVLEKSAEGETTSKLTAKDFQRFDAAYEKMSGQEKSAGRDL